jgi:serine/threonine protein kinase
MEYARGGELNTLMKKIGIIPENFAKKIFKQLHEAVRYIHGKNVIHRDLKPNNVMFLDENYENVIV